MQEALGRWMLGTGLLILVLVVGVAAFVARSEPTFGAAAAEFFGFIVASLPIPGALVVIGLWLNPPDRLRRTPFRIRQAAGVLLLLGAAGFFIQFIYWMLDPIFFSDPNLSEIPLLVAVVFGSSLPLLLFAGVLAYSGYRLLTDTPEPDSETIPTSES